MTLSIELRGTRAEQPRLPDLFVAATRSAGAAPDPFLPDGYLQPRQTFDVGPAARAADTAAAAQAAEVADQEVMVLELADGSSLVTSAARLRDALARAHPELVSGERLNLEALRAAGETTRGAFADAVGGLVSRVFTFGVGAAPDDILRDAAKQFGVDAALLGVSWLGTKALMWAIEKRLPRGPGLYRWDGGDLAGDALVQLDARIAARPDENPVLVFLHGTASHTLGSFGDLPKTGRTAWAALQARFAGGIYGFEHRTLSESPIDNALALLEVLPAGAHLSLVSHSRGGLVGDLLCMGDDFAALIDGYRHDLPGTGDTDEAEARRVIAELAGAHAEQRQKLQRLAGLLAAKQIVVQRYVRVASPAAGTRLASSNFDLFLSGLLSLIGRVPLLLGSPWYAAFKRVVIEIAKNRTNPRLVPGIEAMLPDAPMARLLRGAPVRAGLQMSVIAGDIEGGGMLQRLGVLLVDHLLFEQSDNDLVVDTPAMLAGIAPRAGARVRFDRGAEVSHFRYFENDDTRDALGDWLTAADVSAVDAFRALPGADDYAQALADAARRDADTADLPVVVVLPGVMGSHLGVGRDAASLDRIWFDPLDIARGGLDRIAWGRDGVQAEDLFGMFYGKACGFLAASHRVERFAYDWRQPIDVLADRLAAFLEPLLAGTDKPVRLLAHSMGGLVVRGCIARHRDLMDRLMARPGARLVMMGTPNQGAYSMVANLLGKGDTLRTLVRLDLAHDMQQVLDIVAGFRGALALLPRPGFVDEFEGQPDGGEAGWNFRSADTWAALKPTVRDFWFGNGRAGTPAQDVLDAANWLWAQDGAAPTLPPEYRDRSVYVFGAAPNTPCGLRRVDGQPKLVGTPHGDGTVTWQSGRIGGIGAFYYLPAAHGDLLAMPEHFPAIVSLLDSGATSALPTAPPAVRDVALERPVTYDAGPPLTDDADTAQRRLLGGSARARLGAAAAVRRRLEVVVRAKDLRFVSQPILVGHYEQDPIAGPQALIDREILDGDLGERHRLGLYPGPTGTATVVLRIVRDAEGRPSIGSGAVVTGLGEYDRPLTLARLTDAVRNGALRYLLQTLDVLGNGERELSLSALLLGYNSSANLSVDDSVEALVRGVVEANRAFRDVTGEPIRIARLELVELFIDTAIGAAYALRRLGRRYGDAASALGSQLVCAAELQVHESACHRLYDAAGGNYWPRLVVAQETADAAAAADAGGSRARIANRMRFTYIGQRARAEMVQQQRQPGLIEQLVRLQIASTVWQEPFGRTLFQLMVPHDFKDAARQLDRVLLVVDGGTANLPWELMVSDEPGSGDGRRLPMALRTRVVRQLASGSFRRAVHQSSAEVALVIGNPSVKGFAQAFPGTPERPMTDPPPLPGAENEARAVARVLGERGYAVSAQIGADCEAADVMRALYLKPWRIVHIAAHGIFELLHADGQPRSGVVLSSGLLIGAGEIASMEIVPELVVLNCCHLGKVDGDADRLRDGNRLAASVATELIGIGVRCVIVAGWAVSDRGARTFAETFYAALLRDDQPFGEAVYRARQALWTSAPTDITWGAFQAYGDPAWRPRRAAGAARAGGDGERFVAPEELVAALAQMRFDVARRGQRDNAADKRRRTEALNALLRDRCPAAWQTRADVLTAIGETWRDLGEFAAARDAFQAALRASDGSRAIPLRAIEQLANLEDRLGDTPDDPDSTERSVRRLEALEQATAPPRGPAGSAERQALLGGAHKRRAATLARRWRDAPAEERAALRTAVHRALQRSAECYGRACDAAPASPYPRLNRLLVESVLGPWPPKAALRTPAVAAARQAGVAARLRFDGGGDFWDAAMQADAALVEGVYDGSPGRAGRSGDEVAERLAGAYRDAFRLAAANAAQVDSVVRQIGLFADVLDALHGERAAAARMAERLRLLARQLGDAAPKR